MASLYDITKGEAVELDRVLSQAGFDADMARAAIKSPDLVDVMVAALRERLQPSTGVVLDLRAEFDPQRQIAQIASLNHSRGKRNGWKFGKSDFASLPEPPAWPDDMRLPMIGLTPTLDTVGRTFEEALGFLGQVHSPRYWRWDGLKSDPDYLRLIGGHEFEPGTLRWTIMDGAAYWEPERGRSLVEVRERAAEKNETLASHHVYWNGGHYKTWPQSMNGTTVPYADAAAYEATVPGDEPWAHCPYLDWGGVNRGVRVGAGWVEGSSRDWAAPLVLES
ncbi:MAG TPA: hypothetical protein VFT49_04515 [Candidatus Saccharimonadales bacterium]|nr:hypothetical protein [Candidatus Saccharimonadales bacterium]